MERLYTVRKCQCSEYEQQLMNYTNLLLLFAEQDFKRTAFTHAAIWRQNLEAIIVEKQSKNV